jgi:hypothetical protein
MSNLDWECLDTREAVMAEITRLQITKALKGLSGPDEVADLEKALKGPKTPEVPAMFPLKHIHVADRVFQWRLPHEDVAAKEGHIHNLARALQDDTPFDPILVFPAGKQVYVIDGHHRLAAYRAVKWSKPVPVEAFTGTLGDAQLAALTLNVKDKLPMSRDEKAEAAWRLVKTGKFKVSKIKDTTTVSRSNIYNMEHVFQQLRDMQEGSERKYTPSGINGMS